jgi:hypothetical protein
MGQGRAAGSFPAALACERRLPLATGLVDLWLYTPIGAIALFPAQTGAPPRKSMPDAPDGRCRRESCFHCLFCHIRKILIPAAGSNQYDDVMAIRQANINREEKMNAFQSVSHVASFAMNAYVVYFGISALAFAGYVWKNVYSKAARQESPRGR